MFRNYFKIALRNLWNNKVFSAINIFGLAIGLAICLLITLFVADELSYDKYNEKADRIYRINADFLVNGSVFKERTVPAQLGSVLVNDYPQVERSARITGIGDMLVKKGNETLIEHNATFADSTLFDVFTLPMIVGNPKTALTLANTMVISESMAKKYFNSTDVLGKTLQVGNTDTYTITGVIKDMPSRSHIHMNFIKAMVGLEESRDNNWMTDNFTTYILTKPATDKHMLETYLKQVTKKYMEPSLIKMVGSSISDLEKKGGHFRYDVIPLTKIHLYSTLTNEQEPSGNIQYVYSFIVIAVIILLIACVNFMNLSTARSAGRSKEVGVRKVLGSQRSNLISQFLTESVLTSIIALVLAVFIAILLLPFLNELAGKQMVLNLFAANWIFASLVLAAITVGLLAGSYPAFFLSSFEPVKVLKGKIATGFKGGWLRNSLVVFQFATAIVLIVGTLVIYSQLNYIRNKNLGYKREQVLVLGNIKSLWTHAQTFKSEVLQIKGVEAGTMAGALPTAMDLNTGIYSKDAAQSEGQVLGLTEWSVDADYIPTLGMEMAKGRNFSPKMPTDTQAIVMNETAARLLGFGKDPLSKTLYSGGQALNVIGIVKDFNAGSLRNIIPPVVFRLSEVRSTMAFRISTKNIGATVKQIESAFHGMDGMAGQPFVYSFLDDDFNRLYNAEQRTGKLFLSFAFFAILIACLGLFGLVTYAAEQRTKEIGIRKVLGATVSGIVTLLSREFLKLVMIALIIGSPLAWFIMNRWLQDFAYRINISWWVFVLAAFFAIAITLITVSFQTIKAALANPIKSLKSE
ncbi:putative ABC transport system permease protein [Chitinophaga sp. CF118]|uniref:ABC transporter permease n=1 Tax=Chitinophaga sp. CF118 TaxID=1884367 RepID=UPI0008DEB3F5|nr:ABC transporter permease [Chitinophaga sp. CF118]SFD01914.1 putative ABC transport system permease protein [Chitinophaga sp. CF118]